MNILTITNEEKGYIIAGILFLIFIIVYVVLINIYKDKPLKKDEKLIKEIKDKNKTTQYKQTQQDRLEENEKLPYKLKESVMTKREKIMYIILLEYCNKNNLVLLSKVRIADFVEPIHTNNRRNFYHWFNRISAKHVDYLICDPDSFKPKAAIELDDNTHFYEDRQDRDLFVNNVYKSVELPILHFWDVNETSVNIQLNDLFGIKQNNMN